MHHLRSASKASTWLVRNAWCTFVGFVPGVRFQIHPVWSADLPTKVEFYIYTYIHTQTAAQLCPATARRTSSSGATHGHRGICSRNAGCAALCCCWRPSLLRMYFRKGSCRTMGMPGSLGTGQDSKYIFAHLGASLLKRTALATSAQSATRANSFRRRSHL